MFGMGGGMDPKKMQGMMKKLGIKSEQLDATEVVIKLKDGKTTLIKEPNVVMMDIQGQKTFQIMGKIVDGTESAEPEQKQVSEEDVKLVAEQANVSEEQAKEALEESSGDIAEAILKLKE